MKRGLIPRAFFVTTGVGMDKDPLIAFDIALRDAGIGECNLVEVSSILPANVLEVERQGMTPGEITFCVMSRMDGKEGEVIGASIGYGWFESERGNGEKGYGIICEHHGHYPEDYLKEKVQEKLYRMAEIRDKKLIEKKVYAKSIEIEEDKFGSIVVAVVFLL
ncbi:MAG: pyruvoyl-dependent arginine decarboxylase [Candidatus Methanospirareceae archaeon]